MSKDSFDPIPIGPWVPRQVDGQLVFERTPTLNDPWPGPTRLLPKTTLLPLRICLLGESTAAGWFYAPHITPAAILETQLRALRGGLFEVVDLTRVDLLASALVPLVSASLQLRPDLLVIFAGNNWPVHFNSAAGVSHQDFQQAAEAYREAGARGLMRLTDQLTESGGKEAMGRLAKVTHAAAVPVIIVVPEVNLADWERARPVGWLRDDLTNRWHALCRQAGMKFEGAEYDAAAELAAQMIDLDEGTCATSYRLLAAAHAASGRAGEASLAARAEVNSRAWDNFPNVPGATSTVQEVLRAGAEEHGFGCVDLPAVFDSYLGSQPLGRRLFLDYCHLTLEGISVAMAAVAADVMAVTDATWAPDDDWRAVLLRTPKAVVAPDVEAQAWFMSALYNAHWQSPAGDGLRERVEYWLRRAVEALPDMQDLMLGYIATRNSPPETMLVSAEQQRMYRSAHRLDQRIWNVPNLDPDLIAAMCGVLERLGRSVSQDVNRQLAEHHAPGIDPVDLLLLTYRWGIQEPNAACSSFTYAERLFFQAKWPSSAFCLVWDGSAPIALDVTLRVPHATRSAVTVRVNGSHVERITAGSQWCRSTCIVASDVLQRGVNRVTLEWPPLAQDGTAAIRDILKRLEERIAADVHPVFGEVFSLFASRSVDSERQSV